MGLDNEYSARRVCPVEGCARGVEYIVRAWWTPFDFIEDESCLEHLRGTVNYWNCRVVDGHDPVIGVELVLW